MYIIYYVCCLVKSVPDRGKVFKTHYIFITNLYRGHDKSVAYMYLIRDDVVLYSYTYVVFLLSSDDETSVRHYYKL